MTPTLKAKPILRVTNTDLSGLTIAQIIPAMGAGGAEQAVIDVGRGLVNAGARAIVITSGGNRLAEVEAVGAEIIQLPVASKSPWALRRNAKLIGEQLDKHNICLLHARSRGPAWSSLWATKPRHLPFLCTYHGIYSEGNILKNYYNSVMVRGDAVIANSQYTHDLILERYGLLPKKIHTIHRGIDITAFSEDFVDTQKIDRMRAAWDIATSQEIILLPGRLTSWKGHEIALRAFAQLPAKLKNRHTLVFAGDAQSRDSYVDGLEKLATELSIQNQVRMPGHVNDMPTAVAASKVVINCSTKPEAFGRVAVEAQALGKPVIVSALGPVQETVLCPPLVDDTSRTGWHVPTRDPERLCKALLKCLQLNKQERDSLAKRARMHAESSFSTHKMVQSTLDVYGSLLGR